LPGNFLKIAGLPHLKVFRAGMEMILPRGWLARSAFPKVVLPRICRKRFLEPTKLSIWNRFAGGVRLNRQNCR